jgi:3-(3-hydroxy-phenyl)propionate hydroxylase
VTDCDVAVVGFGPVGATLAALLAKRGLDVEVIDAEVDVFPLPRAAHCDHEAMRIWQEVGCADEMFAHMRENVGMDFLTAQHDVLHRMRSPGLAPTGWPASLFFHQPELERTLRKHTVELGVRTRLGVEVTSLDMHDDHVVLGLADGTTLDAAWVVGCDGARSFVRKELGITMDDLGFEESWLVVDVALHGDAPSLPDRALQICDPARPHTLVPMPEPRFRFEFMLLPGEDPDAMQDPEIVRALMAPWVDPAIVEIERSAVYTFHGLIAHEWRRGRVFLAGDAAHQMPPFLGQGMCSGLRDAANLAWKLDGAHRGEEPDSALDSYQSERAPHVRAIVEQAVGFGRIICTTDATTAAERDAAMLASPAEGQATLAFGDRVYTPQPMIDGHRFDDVVGQRFAVVSRAPLEDTSSERAVFLDAQTHPELTAMLDELETDMVIIRPDRYVHKGKAHA